MRFTCSSLCFSSSSSLFIRSSSSRLARSSSYNTKLLKLSTTTSTISTRPHFLECTHLLHLGQSLLHGLHCRLAGSLLLLFVLLLPLLLLLVLLFFVTLSLVCMDKKKNRLIWHLYSLVINVMFSSLQVEPSYPQLLPLPPPVPPSLLQAPSEGALLSSSLALF